MRSNLQTFLRELQTEKFSLHGTKFVVIEINTYFRELKMNQVKQPKQPKALPSLKDAVSFRLLPDVYQHPSKFQKEITLNLDSKSF